MYNLNQNFVIEQIEQIINRSRYGDELFFTDGRQAATAILKFLEKENILNHNEMFLEINYSMQGKAA